MSNRSALFHIRALPTAALALAAVGMTGSVHAQNVTNGATLYKQAVPIPGGSPASCENCHGPAYIFKAASTAGAISAAINSNRGGMSVYSSWNATQLADVAAYVAAAMPPSLPPLPSPPPTPPPPSPPFVSRIDLQGSNLHLVTAAQIRANGVWVPATISNRLQDSLTLTPSSTLPIGVPMPVELIVPGQPNIQAGTVHVQNNGAIYLFGAEVAQVHSRQVETAPVRLTPGRPFLLRVPVLATSSISPPAVTATVARNGVPVGSVTLTGPAVLSGTYDPTLNGSMFSAVIPGSWVTPGIQVTVSVATAPATQMTFSPTVGAPAKLNVVLVPIQIGTSTGVPPSAATLQDALARTYPVARQDITVETRAAMAVNVTTPVTATQMGQINLSLLQRQLNEPGKVFYGVIPASALPQTGSFTSGLALAIPDLANQSTWLMSASGYDYPLAFSTLDRFGLGWNQQMTTLLHELGHLHSRRHAPCGSPAGPDPNYPWPDGKHGSEPLYSSTYANDLPGAVAAARLPSNPPATTGLIPNDRLGDLMGYCESSWFSTYNYDHVQKFLERRTAVMQAVSAQARLQAQADAAAGKSERRYLVLSGIIGQFGVTMAPAQVLPYAPVAPQSGGPYSMAIRTVAGEVIKVDFAAPDVSHDAAKSFTIVLPDPGPVASIEVSKALRAIPLANASTRARAQGATQAAAAKGTTSVAWALESEHVTVRWSAVTEPFLAVTLAHQDGRRELIASELTGGQVRVQTGARPDGTRVELNLGSEFGARVVVAE